MKNMMLGLALGLIVGSTVHSAPWPSKSQFQGYVQSLALFEGNGQNLEQGGFINPSEATKNFNIRTDGIANKHLPTLIKKYANSLTPKAAQALAKSLFDSPQDREEHAKIFIKDYNIPKVTKIQNMWRDYTARKKVAQQKKADLEEADLDEQDRLRIHQ